MDHQWQTYADSSANRPAQLGNGFGAPPTQASQKHMASHSQQPQAPLGYSYEPYHPSDTVPAAPTSNAGSKSISMTSSPSGTPLMREFLPDADIPMEDADPYNSTKYAPTRSSQQHHRASSQFLSGEESSASRRYSPMNIQPPSQSYNPSPSLSQTPYALASGPTSSRPSPTRSNTFSSQPQTYQSPPCTYYQLLGFASLRCNHACSIAIRSVFTLVIICFQPAGFFEYLLTCPWFSCVFTPTSSTASPSPVIGDGE